MPGWFKIWRKAFMNPYLREADAFKLFFYLVSECSWEREERFIKQARAVIVLERGQCWVSIRQLVEEIGVTKRRIDTLMKRLKTGTLIGTQTGTHGTIVTICNYDEYQTDEKKPGHKPGHKPGSHRDTTGTPIDKEEEEREEGKNGSTAPNGSAYAFEGRLVKLNRGDFDRWEKAFPSIPNLTAELTAADAYYDEELKGADRKKWFIRLSQALANKNAKYAKQEITDERPPAWAMC